VAEAPGAPHAPGAAGPADGERRQAEHVVGPRHRVEGSGAEAGEGGGHGRLLVLRQASDARRNQPCFSKSMTIWVTSSTVSPSPAFSAAARASRTPSR